jgi:hypothetical protein
MDLVPKGLEESVGEAKPDGAAAHDWFAVERHAHNVRLLFREMLISPDCSAGVLLFAPLPLVRVPHTEATDRQTR